MPNTAFWSSLGIRSLLIIAIFFFFVSFIGDQTECMLIFLFFGVDFGSQCLNCYCIVVIRWSG